ncbi:MAG: hypothetical protein ACP5MB_11175 [bacterium]
MALLASLPIILYEAIEKKKKVFDFIAVADAITIAVLIFFALFFASSVSAKLSVSVNVPLTVLGFNGGYSIGHVTLDGYTPNTVIGSFPLTFSLFNGNTVYTVVKAYCSPGASGNYTLVSSGSVASVFPSFTFPYSKIVNVTVPNIPEGDNCIFRAYLTNSNNQIISNIVNTGITEASP